MSQHPQARDALRQLAARREPLYARAEVTVDTSTTDIDDVVKRLAANPKVA